MEQPQRLRLEHRIHGVHRDGEKVAEKQPRIRIQTTTQFTHKPYDYNSREWASWSGLGCNDNGEK